MISVTLISLCWTEIIGLFFFVQNGKAIIAVLLNNTVERGWDCQSEWCIYFMLLSPKIGSQHFCYMDLFYPLVYTWFELRKTWSIRSVDLWRDWDGERPHVVIFKVVFHSSTLAHVSSCRCRTQGFQTHFLCTTITAWSSPTTMRRYSNTHAHTTSPISCPCTLYTHQCTLSPVCVLDPARPPSPHWVGFKCDYWSDVCASTSNPFQQSTYPSSP